MSHVLKYNISNFSHIRNSLSTEAAQMYLNAVILPYILYCIKLYLLVKDNQVI